MTTVGILYPGDMGATMGTLLRAHGTDVVTTLAGRSPRTRTLCDAAGLTVLDSVADVARAADVVVSLVPPSAALAVAQDFVEQRPAGARARLYVDANSISPRTAAAIAELVEERGVSFVDASIRGLAARVANHGILYLSGARAPEVAVLFDPCLRVQYVGDEPGRASMLKMLMGGMSKGLAALFLQISLAAREADLVDEFLAGCRLYYPDVVAAMEQVLPTYPQHAGRRAEEMQEVEQAMSDLGLHAGVVGEAKRLFAALADSTLAERYARRCAPARDVSEMIEVIALEQPLGVERALAHD